MKRLHLTKAALTLMEVLIVMAIFTVMIGSLYSALTLSERSWTIYSETTAPKQTIRMVMAAMVRELREAEEPFITKEQSGIKLSFQRPKYGRVEYAWTNQGKDAGKIIRTNYTQQGVLAYRVGSLEFTLLTSNLILIHCASSADPNIALDTEVTLRNKTGLIMQGQNEKIR